MINISQDDQELAEWAFTGSSQDYLLSLLRTSTFDERHREPIEIMIDEITEEDEYNKIVFILVNNQLDRITSGMSYNQGDISAHLKKLR